MPDKPVPFRCMKWKYVYKYARREKKRKKKKACFNEKCTEKLALGRFGARAYVFLQI